jgi:hypothetical protein
MEENINNEAMLGMMPKIEKRLEIIQVNTKPKDIQSVNQPISPVVSAEEIDKIIVPYTNYVGKFFEKSPKLEVEKLNLVITGINEVKQQIAALPKPSCKFQQQPPVEISFEQILKLVPKIKTVTIGGFEFLRSSVIIFVLALAVFCLFILNIKQMDIHIMERIFQKLKLPKKHSITILNNHSMIC